MAPTLSKQEQVSEYIRCKNSFEYFSEHYILIELPGGDVNFNMYKRQKEMIHLLEEVKYLITLKSRQTGISTTLQAYCAWLVTFFDNVVVGILSKDSGEATSFARTIRSMVEKLPSWMSPGFSKYTEQTFITKKTSSKVISATVNPQEPTKTLRGKAITFLVIDEAAFIQKIDEAWESIAPALSTAQKGARKANIPYGTAIVSTPNKTNGIGKFYFEQWSYANNAIAPDSISNTLFRPIVVHWKDIPELADDPYWYSNTCALFNNDPRRIKQELELQFIPVGGSFFDENICSLLQENTQDLKPKQIFKLFNGEIWKYQDPIPGKYYIIGVDTASEYGKDMSAITVWDYETLDQVWEYNGKLPVTDFCKVVHYVCGEYSNAMVVVENNSLGNQVAESVDFSPYMHMLYKEKRGEQMVRGVSTNAKTRPLMIDAMYSYVTQFPGMVKSKRLALELVGLVTKSSGKVEGDDGCRDDLALTLAFCMYVRKYDPPLMLSYEKQTDGMLEKIMNMNYGNSVFDESSNNDDINARVMKKVKDDMFEDKTNNYFNILDFYSRS